MFRFPLWLLLVYIFNSCAPTVGFSMLGPVDLVFQRTEHCDPELHVVDFWISRRKFNRTDDVLDIIISNPYPIDDRLVIELKGWLKKEGGYKPGALYYKDLVCKTLDKWLGDMFHTVLRLAGSEDCPLAPGHHSIVDFYFDNKSFNVQQVYGEYKLEIYLYKEEELQTCLIFFFDFVPKGS